MVKNSFPFKILFILLIIIFVTTIILFFYYFFNKEKMFSKSFEITRDIKTEPVFDPFTLTWQEIKSVIPWEARDSHTVTVFQNKLWLIGGLNANDYVIAPGRVQYGDAPHFNDIWVSEDGINWDLITNQAPWGKRRSIQGTVFQDKIWILPGWGPETGLQSNLWSSNNGINWEQAVLNGPWPEREGHQLIVFNEKLWLIGGVDYNKRITKNDVWFSENGIDWFNATTTAPWPSRWDHEVVDFKNKLWLIGGMDLQDNTFNDVWVSEDGINWDLITNNPPWTKRQGHELVIFQDKIWIIGRFSSPIQGGGENDVWFSENGIDWQKTTLNPEWEGREDHAAVVFKDKIWVLGGMTIDWVWKNDIWYSVFK